MSALEQWSIGGSAYWEEWGFDATNREKNELCFFPVLHHSNTPTSFGFISGVHLLITSCRSSKSKVSSKAYRQMGGETTVAIGKYLLPGRSGEFVSFVGPSGCGKTTLLMSIAGLVAPQQENRGEGARGQRSATQPRSGFPGVQ